MLAEHRSLDSPVSRLPQPQPPITRYLDVLGRQARLIVLVVALGLAVTAAITYTRQSVYRASTQIVVGQGGGIFQAQFGSAVEPFTQTMTNLLKSNIVASTVVKNLRLDATPEELLRNIHVTSKPQSSVLEVSYDAPTSGQPLRVLREVGKVFTQLVDQKLGEQSPRVAGTAALPVITATVFDSAHLEAQRVSPRPARSLAFAGVLGLALGVIFAFVRESVDVRIRSRGDAEEWFGAPVTGSLPPGLRGKPPFGLLRQGPPKDRMLAEALHFLRANLEFSQTALQGPTIVVTSALPEEGKTTVATNLSVALASAGNDVICVEADMRKPRVHEYMGLVASSSGLMDVLEGRTDLDRALQEVPLTPTSRSLSSGPLPHYVTALGETPAPQHATSPNGRLRVLLTGRPPAASMMTQLFTGERIAQLIEQLSTRAKYVIFDTPPLLLVGDAFPLIVRADSVLLVARENRTTKGSAEAVRATLRGLEVDNASVILTDSRDGYGSQYAYGYGYGERPARIS